MKLSFSFVFFMNFFFGSCNLATREEIYGTWQNSGPSKDVITFNRDGTLSNSKGKFDVVTAVTPKQLYMIIGEGEEATRVPFAIYDIRGDKLVLGMAIHYQKTYGGISFGGVSRSEFPKDFSGEVLEYRRVR